MRDQLREQAPAIDASAVLSEHAVGGRPRCPAPCSGNRPHRGSRGPSANGHRYVCGDVEIFGRSARRRRCARVPRKAANCRCAGPGTNDVTQHWVSAIAAGILKWHSQVYACPKPFTTSMAARGRSRTIALKLREGWGFAPDPTRRLCLLDLQQRARPFAICPLVGEWKGADTDLETSRSAPFHSPTKMNGSAGHCPWLGSRGPEAPWSGPGETRHLSHPRHRPGGYPAHHASMSRTTLG